MRAICMLVLGVGFVAGPIGCGGDEDKEEPKPRDEVYCEMAEECESPEAAGCSSYWTAYLACAEREFSPELFEALVAYEDCKHSDCRTMERWERFLSAPEAQAKPGICSDEYDDYYWLSNAAVSSLSTCRVEAGG